MAAVVLSSLHFVSQIHKLAAAAMLEFSFIGEANP
jgi:hypothetical protein